jgi:predicted transcriptional regulator
MSERRSKLEIIGDILNAIQAKGGTIKPTHLLYKSNLSHERMKLYVEELETKGLVEEKELKNKKMFVITDKGFEFLASFRKVKEMEDAFGI